VTTVSASDIEDQEFPSTRRGYDTRAVRSFLEVAAARVRDLDQLLGRRTADSVRLNDELRLAKLEVGTLEGKLVQQQLLHRRLCLRLELSEALRRDALARALAAEAGRHRAERVLAEVEPRRRPAQLPLPPRHVEPRSGPTQVPLPPPHVESREAGEYVRRSAAGGAGAGWDRLLHDSAPTSDAISAIFSETDEAVRTLSTRFQQTEEHIRVMEEAAQVLAEANEANAQQVLDGARRDADRITISARQIAEVWDSFLGEVRDDIERVRGALVDLPPTSRSRADPVGRRASDGGHEMPTEADTPARFRTDQAMAAATSLHAAARHDLHLAEFWIQEATQETTDVSVQTTRSILEEANLLLKMAEELGHPAAYLVEQHDELGRQLRLLQE